MHPILELIFLNYCYFHEKCIYNSISFLNMKILVTGSAGFIGYHLSKKLIDSNHEVFGIDNLNDYYDPSLKKGVKIGYKFGLEFFYSKLAKYHRPRSIFKHTLGQNIKNDKIIFEEKEDDSFTCSISLSADEKYFIISTGNHMTLSLIHI